ncbi:MAG: nucleotidyl transferase AbiEii/AbiGii toxin family protein [Vicinamibacteria bacterium]|jgi:hypothetical protein|nr:nucleotidyl transferase AbiEii/AbiGii toxin family protein [Vicinamibacteria bacterium]
MTPAKLTALQRRILRILAGLTPPPTLIGGAALIGFHLGHRKTRDVDLIWKGRPELGDLANDAMRALRSAGLSVGKLQEAPSFARFRIEDESDVCLVDLIADPAPPIMHPETVDLDNQSLLIETRAVALVSKLCALLGRSEIRDLIDIQALVGSGEDLQSAIAMAPMVDGGFSPLTLAWLLKDLNIGRLADAEDLDESRIRDLDSFRSRLIELLLTSSKPE